MRILLLGGSKSGKSGLAQRLARDLSEGNSLYYWATMEPTDEEDRAR
ncbi:adenosylcobinamide kinase/adenosylcobinamide-phosphate guanylyltransferase, partial [Xanthomonas citri pv. citri]|nr:adenosylcobinamide kinase/adenosylcobinamide-phosphate guanylyltransferase [Xanthomonas citri pv. citri]